MTKRILTRRRLLATAGSAVMLAGVSRPYLSRAADRPVVTHGIHPGTGAHWFSSRTLPAGYVAQPETWRLSWSERPTTVLLYECANAAGDATWLMRGASWEAATPVRKVLEPSRDGPDNGYAGVGGVYIDAKNKQLIFRGTAEDEISDNPEKNAKRLEKASTKLFKNFPPAAKAK